jgi:Anti-sigma-K factor rskA
VKRPDFDDLIGADVPPEERARLYRTHELLVQAGPPPELSPEMEAVPWPDDALQPLIGGRRRPRSGRRVLLLAAALTTALVVGLLLGQATSSDNSGTSIEAAKTVEMQGTALARGALATLRLGKADAAGNWPMVLHVSGLPKLTQGGYYALFLTKGGKPLVSCGTINVSGATSVRLSAAYALEHFDKDGWVIVRQTPANHFQPNQIVLKAA